MVLGADQLYEEVIVAIAEIDEEQYILSGLTIGKLVVGGSYDILFSYNYIVSFFGLPQVPLHLL